MPVYLSHRSGRTVKQKQMKKVFSSHAEVAHVFAQRSQSEGSASNLFFEGDTIYSYGRHFALAQFITTMTGEVILLVNGLRYSHFTAKHRTRVVQATRQYRQIFLPVLDNRIGASLKYSEADTLAGKLSSNTYLCVNAWMKELREIENKLAKAKKPEIYIRQTQQIDHVVSEYFLAIGAEVPADIKEMLKMAVPSEDMIQRIKDRKAKEEQAEERRQAEQAQKWLSGEIDYPGKLKYDLLRKFGEVVETSQGVKMTIQDAKGIYLQLIRQELKPGDKVLTGYTVISINGTVKIGCHTFRTDYLLNFGKLL